MAGYSTYQVTTRIDDGPLLRQEEICIEDGDTAKSLYDRLCAKVVESYPKVLDAIVEQNWRPLSPSYRDSIYHVKGMPNDRWISWQWHTDFISRFCRALSFPPYPGPRTRIKGETREIPFAFSRIGALSTQDVPGTVLDKQGATLKVAGRNGTIIAKLLDHADIAALNRGTLLDCVVGNCHPIAVDFPHGRLPMRDL